MTRLINIELTINMPDGGRHARQLLNLYLPDMHADIQETAYHLCDANAALQEQKFAKLDLRRSEVWSSQEGSLKIFAILSVMGEDPKFIQQVFAKFMEGFPGYLRRASGRYFTHADFPPEIPLEPTDWGAEIH